MGKALSKTKTMKRALNLKFADDEDASEFAQEFARIPKRDRSTYQFFVHTEVIDFKAHATIVSQEGSEINIITSIDGRDQKLSTYSQPVQKIVPLQNNRSYALHL